MVENCLIRPQDTRLSQFATRRPVVGSTSGPGLSVTQPISVIFEKTSADVSLNSQNRKFHRTECYKHGTVDVYLDVYLIRQQNSDDVVDSLYVKLHFGNGFVTIHSFHLER